jgi:hypothetical protein
MSDHSPKIKPADDPAFKLPESLGALSIPLCVGGIAALVIGWMLGWFAVDARFGMSAYLTAFTYCLTIAIGSMFFVIIQHLVRAGWSVVVRRIAELLMMMVLPLAVLFLPVLVAVWVGGGTLYEWTNENFVEDTGFDAQAWANKTGYLNPGFFTLRAVFYLAVWIAMALYYFKGSSRQDETGEISITERLQARSGPALIVLSLTTSFAMFDWVMSLAPTWFSTMFGVYLFAGGMLSAHSALAVGSYVLQSRGALRDEITVEHYHDLGKFMFGFTFFWTYIAFSQFMLIWYANMPEETEWFFDRQEGSWLWISLILIFFHWMLPFAGTMSRHVRRRPTLVALWGAYLLIMHFVDIYWIIMPEAEQGMGGVTGILASLLCAAGMSALMLGLVLSKAGQTGVVPARDPRLLESLQFHQI